MLVGAVKLLWLKFCGHLTNFIALLWIAYSAECHISSTLSETERPDPSEVLPKQTVR